jgi:ankyrin repeat protein
MHVRSTPLHWAAINAQLATCRYLIEQGAEIDAIGGDLQATPLQWAARNGYLYVVQLLISHNADPTITDTQGYNSLHLVTHSSSVMPLLYLLHQPVNVDSRDLQGHTSLMWAAYQGDALSVDLLLKHSANPNLKDDAGLSPLHWAVVRGNRVILRRLIEMGADMHAKDLEGRTPRDMAVELKSLGAWKRAMEEAGLTEYGVVKAKPLNEVRPCPSISDCNPDPVLAQYQNRYIRFTFLISIFHLHDTFYSSMVYRHHTRHRRVLCHASRK